MHFPTLISLLSATLALATPNPLPISKRYNYDIQEPGAMDVVASGTPFLGEDDGYGWYFQTDGNFVIYVVENYKNVPVWASNTAGHNCENQNCHLIFQVDGNLVIYVDGTAVWNTGTVHKGAELWFRNSEPYITIYGQEHGVVWTSGYPVPVPIPPPCVLPGDIACVPI